MDEQKGGLPQAPRAIKITIVAAYFAIWILNLYAARERTLDTIRTVLKAWIAIYALEVAIVFFPGWLSSPWVVKEMILHHSFSAFSLAIVVAIPPSVNQPIFVRTLGIWMLVNLNEAVFILVDVLGLSQRDSVLSIARRVFLPVYINIVVPAMVVCVNRHMIAGFGTPSTDGFSSACCWCSVFLGNAFAYIYYPYVGFRCVRSVQRTASTWKSVAKGVEAPSKEVSTILVLEA